MVTGPFLFSKVFRPFVKSQISGTWAYTLFAQIKSAFLFIFFANFDEKKLFITFIPNFSLFFERLKAGSIPTQGIFFFTKFLSR